MKISDLKVGDRFVISREILTKNWNDQMGQYLGTVVTVTIARTNGFRVKENSWFWNSEMVDLEATEKLNSTPKAMLRSGDKLTTNAYDVRYVLLETRSLYAQDGSRVCGLNLYNDNLGLIGDTICVTKVERAGQIIWERPKKSAKDREIERIENEMKQLAMDLQRIGRS